LADSQPKLKKRNTAKKHESILQAAMKAFSEEGFEKVSMDRIADLAGASKRTVYNHFPSKELLFQAVIAQFTAEMRLLKQIRYDAARSLEDQLADFADAELALLDNPTWLGFIKVLLTEFIRDPQMARRAVAEHAAGPDNLTEWMRAAKEDGGLSVEDPRMASRVFASMLGGAFTWPAVYQGYLDPAQIGPLKKELIDTFLSRFRTRTG
jgi:TetR/AcrR family transcriptional regulator, regulator of autoinduction and epiphytic fitness